MDSPMGKHGLVPRRFPDLSPWVPRSLTTKRPCRGEATGDSGFVREALSRGFSTKVGPVGGRRRGRDARPGGGGLFGNRGGSRRGARQGGSSQGQRGDP